MAWKIDGILERLGILKDSTTGMAFSGGGAKGFSHIGVLKAFEQFDIRPDVISGVSAGAIAAALYGAGLTPDEMAECFAEASGIGDFTEWAIPKQGFMRLTRFAKLLESWLPVRNLEDMKIPTVICATDLDHGKSVGWSKGELVPRVIASCSIPIIFHPVKINGVNYVDGGVLRNLPAWAIRQYCTTLYGSNCSPMRKEYEHTGSIIDVAYRTFHLMMKSNTPQDLRLCDHVIEVESVTSIKTFDLKSLRKAVTAGYDAASRVLEKLQET
jgi:NTE family protein